MTTTEPQPRPGEADFVLALGEIADVVKRSTAKVETRAGGSFSYTYANLADVNEMARPILAKYNLGVTFQTTTANFQTVEVSCTIVHASGWYWVNGPLTMRAGDTPQTLGSAITYARRYLLCAVLNIATEDDDGQAAAAAVERQAKPGVRRKVKPPVAPDPNAPPVIVIEDTVATAIIEMFDAIEDAEERKDAKAEFANLFGAPKYLPREQLDDAMSWIEAHVPSEPVK